MIEVNYIQGNSAICAGSISGFGNPGNYIRSINLPRKLKVGEEYISTNIPTLKLNRSSNVFKELLKKPYFRITKKIRVQFHWEGVKIVGSYMEEPNKFVFPIPNKKGDYSWYLKIICSNDTKPGFKPLYISIDTLDENMLLKWLLKSFKFFSLIALIGIVCIGIFYRDSIIGEKIFFGNVLSNETLMGNSLSPFLLFLILLVAFWKNISATFESVYKQEKREFDQNIRYEGLKGFSKKYGIEIINNA